MLSFFTEEGEACPSGYVIDGLFGDSLEMRPHEPVPGCRCRMRLGLADAHMTTHQHLPIQTDEAP